MTRIIVLLLGIAIMSPLPAQAGVFENVYRGLEILTEPSGFPVNTLQDGTRVNGSRFGRLRIMPSGLGGGYELQVDRSFAVDNRGRPEVLRLFGMGEVELNGLTQLTLGYNGEDFRTVYGSAAINNLSYAVRSKYGVQDMEARGTYTGTAQFEINPLGFYDISFDGVHNNASVTLDGVVIRDEEEANFDVGPVSISGNIYYDGLLALLATLGVDTTQLEGAFPGSPIDQINDAIRTEMQFSPLAAGASDLLPMGPFRNEDALRTSPDAAAELIGGEGGDSGSPTRVPEPGTLLLVGSGAALAWHWQRRR